MQRRARGGSRAGAARRETTMADDNRNAGDKEPSGNSWMKSLLIWAGIILAQVLVVQMVGGGASASQTSLPYSDFLAKVDDGSVKSVAIG